MYKEKAGRLKNPSDFIFHDGYYCIFFYLMQRYTSINNLGLTIKIIPKRTNLSKLTN